MNEWVGDRWIDEWDVWVGGWKGEWVDGWIPWMGGFNDPRIIKAFCFSLISELNSTSCVYAEPSIGRLGIQVCLT